MVLKTNTYRKCVSESSTGMFPGSTWWFDIKVIESLVLIAALILPHSHGIEEHAHQTSVTYYWAVGNLSYTDPQTKKLVHEGYTGKYGTSSLVEYQSGIAVHVRNKDNQTHGCDDYNIKLPSEKWIAVVERGNCYFTDKINVATKKYNASAVVIYNFEDSLTIMAHKVSDQVSIFVSQEVGKKLASLSDAGVRVMMTIAPGAKDITSDYSHNTISKTSVLFVSISFIVLMIISLAWLVFYYIQRFRYAHAKERLARRLASAAKKAISKIPQKTIRNGDRELDNEFDQCAVCIESYKSHDVIRTLPCKHVFHKSCVDPWLLDQRSCPMCKLDILRAYGMQVFNSQESVHPEVESVAVSVPAEDHEPSSTTDDQAAADVEVKVLLLPYSCLHFQPGQGCMAPDSISARNRPDSEGQFSPVNAVTVQISSSELKDGLTISPSHTALGTDRQALLFVEQGVEDEDDGFDEHHPFVQSDQEKESFPTVVNIDSSRSLTRSENV